MNPLPAAMLIGFALAQKYRRALIRKPFNIFKMKSNEFRAPSHRVIGNQNNEKAIHDEITGLGVAPDCIALIQLGQARRNLPMGGRVGWESRVLIRGVIAFGSWPSVSRAVQQSAPRVKMDR